MCMEGSGLLPVFRQLRTNSPRSTRDFPNRRFSTSMVSPAREFRNSPREAQNGHVLCDTGATPTATRITTRSRARRRETGKDLACLAALLGVGILRRAWLNLDFDPGSGADSDRDADADSVGCFSPRRPFEETNDDADNGRAAHTPLFVGSSCASRAGLALHLDLHDMGVVSAFEAGTA